MDLNIKSNMPPSYYSTEITRGKKAINNISKWLPYHVARIKELKKQGQQARTKQLNKLKILQNNK